MSLDENQRLQNLMSVLGIRAPIAAALVLQLVTELRRLAVLDDEAVERIKDAGVRGAFSFRPQHMPTGEFEANTRELFDRLLGEIDVPGSSSGAADRREG